MWERECWWVVGREGRFERCPSSSSSEASSSSSDGGSTEESREKSSIDAGSEWEVMMSGETGCSGCSVAGVALAVTLTGLLVVVSRARKVGRFGVDFDWKPAGSGGGLSGVPLLCGGIVDLQVSNGQGRG